MEDKSKLFVFDKKEIALIFLFMIIISVISFTFGFRMGKKISYETAGVTQTDQQLVEMKSVQEEEANAIFENVQEQDEKVVNKEIQSDSKNELKEEFEDLREQNYPKVKNTPQAMSKKKTENVVRNEPAPVAPKEISKAATSNDMIVKEGEAKNDYVGKYTIQLGSHQKLDEAKEFADGFTIRGYNPIINEVHLKDRGTWYRVSLGVFDSVAAAKDYIKEEESLFQGSNYVITEFN